MPRWYEDNSRSIVRAPLVRLSHSTDGAGDAVLAKIKNRNPTHSLKCRIGAAMVGDAEHRGLLEPGKELVEPTSGNTGIALAFVAGGRGNPLTLAMPETMSIERCKRLVAIEARLVLTEGAKDMPGAITKIEEFVSPDSDRFMWLQRLKNPGNPVHHETTTGAEIWDDTDGELDTFVAGVDTGGTLTGVTHYLKFTRAKPIRPVTMEPATSPILSQTRAGEPLQRAPQDIQGIGAGCEPEILDLSRVDTIETVSHEVAIEPIRRRAREEGSFAGTSCGAAVVVALCRDRQAEHSGKTTVVPQPDSGERYLNSALYDGLFDAQGLAA